MYFYPTLQKEIEEYPLLKEQILEEEFSTMICCINEGQEVLYTQSFVYYTVMSLRKHNEAEFVFAEERQPI